MTDAEDDENVRARRGRKLAICPGETWAARPKVYVRRHDALDSFPPLLRRKGTGAIGGSKEGVELASKLFGAGGVSFAGVRRKANRSTSELVLDFAPVLAESLVVEEEILVEVGDDFVEMGGEEKCSEFACVLVLNVGERMIPVAQSHNQQDVGRDNDFALRKTEGVGDID
jgi:hypothetical protein